MEDVAFNNDEWPPGGDNNSAMADPSGANFWLPAYGFQTPQTLLERDDFLGNPDADYFLQGNVMTPCLYLETIHEETSDDLRSDISTDCTESPMLMPDCSSSTSAACSEINDDDDSVICNNNDFSLTIEDEESDREIACPIKRRRRCQDNHCKFLIEGGGGGDDTCQSLSRSSSLVQFETLEKECLQEGGGGSISSQYSVDSLEIIQSGCNKNRSSSEDSDVTRLRSTRSFDSLLQQKTIVSVNGNKISAENLSEDSGYSDHMYIVTKRKTHSRKSFEAYDYRDVCVRTVSANFGASCQNLSLLVDPQPQQPTIILEQPKECHAKYKSSSDPHLQRHRFEEDVKFSSAQIATSFGSCSVPKNLNVAGGQSDVEQTTIAAKNWDLSAMATYKKREGSYAEAMSNRVDLSDDEHSLRYKDKAAVVKRQQRQSLKENPLIEFDKRVLSAISESLHSLNTSITDAYLNHLYNTDILSRRDDDSCSIMAARNDRCAMMAAASTPNLMTIGPNVEEKRKLSLATQHSTSTSNITSDLEQEVSKAMESSVSSTKGVHFSPVVDEVNWKDNDSASTIEREAESSSSSTYSIASSTPDRETISTLTEKLLKRSVTPPCRVLTYGSQPELTRMSGETSTALSRQNNDQQERLLRIQSQSQPDVSRLKRRGSQLVKKDGDGCIIKAYVDGDGIQYRHTHLDLDNNVYGTKIVASSSSSEIPATSSPGHVTKGGAAQKQQRSGAVAMETVAMEASLPRRQPQQTNAKSRKLGGFFSRLTSFRFSARNKDENKKNKKGNKNYEQASAISPGQLLPQQPVARKEDYIYIPLKGPSIEPPQTSTTKIHSNNNHGNNHHSNNNNVLLGKPPLPRAPPRVVGASVKQGGGGGVATHQRHQKPSKDGIDSTAASKTCQQRPMEPMGLIETDLDTEVTVITTNNILNNNNNTSKNHGGGVKTRSLLDLGGGGSVTASSSCATQKEQLTGGGGLLLGHQETSEGGRGHRPHKSMEFLLDKQNLKVVEPPENQLQKGGERVMSEHELRVQRSLQKLNVPDWYKQNSVPREGFLLNKNRRERPNESRWCGTNSKTTSLSSLGSSSPTILSPNSSASTGGQHAPFIRWSTSKLNSTASSPCASIRSSFNQRQNGSVSPSATSVRSSFSYRQPYMGWRSQERLSKPRTPHERLANSVLSQQQQQQQSTEIQSSIKEVTSAIVHYVSGLKPAEDSGSSPRGSTQKLCWLESSFVGIKPLDSPQTPSGLEQQQQQAPSSAGLRLELHNDVRHSSSSALLKPSPGSTTLEDVLDSLLGLPPSERVPSPSLQGTESAANGQRRRSSEGSTASSRRVSIQSSPVLQCRYSKCSKMARASGPEAQTFKNCHNCSYTYCSRACRRAHWEKHRKTCLFSRIGTLSKDIISAVKQNTDALYHVSIIARRGYLSHGSGAVKCFFGNADSAETFLTHGHSQLGELTYVRWQDLLPSEMGTQLYSELVHMCKTYNPDTKLIVYVSICVVSEAPSNRWERQLVSRCAKLRLSRDILRENNAETLLLFTPNCEQTREQKEDCLATIEKELRMRGVLLRKQHPMIFRQLRAYADDMCDSRMAPITVYPRNTDSGKSFMCIIMLDTDMDSLRQVENAGVAVRTVNLLMNN